MLIFILLICFGFLTPNGFTIGQLIFNVGHTAPSIKSLYLQLNFHAAFVCWSERSNHLSTVRDVNSTPGPSIIFLFDFFPELPNCRASILIIRIS